MWFDGTPIERPRPPQPPSEADGLLGPPAAKAEAEEPSPSPFRPPGRLLLHFDRDSIQFGVRMSVCLTISSLFSLAQIPGEDGGFQQGMWVAITVLFVCWFPSLDAASVAEKSGQRLAGTLVGAALGLGCGFLSLGVRGGRGVRAQAVFLGGCVAGVSFAVTSFATARVGGRAGRLVERKSYATVLCLLTFTIALMPFYDASDRPWEKALYRVRNVLLGCVLGVALSCAVFPRPTVSILDAKIVRQIELAGEAAEAVLHTAADAFAEEVYVPPADASPTGGDSSLRDPETRERISISERDWRDAGSDLGHEAVLEKFEAARKLQGTVRAQLKMLKHDPLNLGRPKELLQTFKDEVTRILAIAMRMQTTVVHIDGIVRNDPWHRFSGKNLRLLANVGTLMRTMLTAPLNVAASDVAEERLGRRLSEVRRTIISLMATVAASPEAQLPPKKLSDGRLDRSIAGAPPQVDVDIGFPEQAPKLVRGSLMCSLLFLQLAEQLAHRSMRLYQSWKQYDRPATKMSRVFSMKYLRQREGAEK